MPKHDPLSAKGISNRQKSIGLQRLRWYCQMCSKQCRDENGFKCHTMSESHLRQMRVFAENPNSILDEFSCEFERGYLETLSHLHGTKRVKANTVYQEYIADKHHIHMNATAWTSLTGFLMHLGKDSKAIVDETEKGWFIQFIDRDPKVLARQAQSEQRQQYELDEEERKKREIAAQIQQAYSENNNNEEEVDNTLVRNVNNEKIAVDLKLTTNNSTNLLSKKRLLTNVFGFSVDEDDNNNINVKKKAIIPGSLSSHPLTTTTSATATIAITTSQYSGSTNNLSMIQQQQQQQYSKMGSSSNSMLSMMMKEEEQRKQMKLSKQITTNTNSYTTTSQDISTSSNSNSNSYYKQDADSLYRDNNNNKTIKSNNDYMNDKNDSFNEKVKSNDQTTISLSNDNKRSIDYWLYPNIIVKIINKKLEDGHLFKEKGIIKALRSKYEAEVLVNGKVYILDQDDLQTVIPKVGQSILIVNGHERGYTGIMMKINEEKYNCIIKITDHRSLLYNKELSNVEYEDICKLKES